MQHWGPCRPWTSRPRCGMAGTIGRVGEGETDPSYIWPEACSLSTGRGEAGPGPLGALGGASMAGRQRWFPGAPGRSVAGRGMGSCSCTAGQATITQLPLPGRLGRRKDLWRWLSSEASLFHGIAGKCSLPSSSQLPGLARGLGCPLLSWSPPCSTWWARWRWPWRAGGPTSREWCRPRILSVLHLAFIKQTLCARHSARPCGIKAHAPRKMRWLQGVGVQDTAINVISTTTWEKKYTDGIRREVTD